MQTCGGVAPSASRPGEVFCAHCMKRNPASNTTCFKCGKMLGTGGDGFSVPRPPPGAVSTLDPVPYSLNISGGPYVNVSGNSDVYGAEEPVAQGIPVNPCMCTVGATTTTTTTTTMATAVAGAQPLQPSVGIPDVNPVIEPEVRQEKRKRNTTKRMFLLALGLLCFPCICIAQQCCDEEAQCHCEDVDD
jgi:hypothetical protein